ALEKTELIKELIQNEQFEALQKKLDERDRIIKILSTITNKMNLVQIENQFPQFNQIISKIQKYDEQITTDLISLKNSVHLEIAKTFKTKENFKGYNLNNIK